MKVSPWYSTERLDDPHELVFHHNNTICLDGKRIDKNHHRYGTDNRPLCKRCGTLNDSGR